MLKNLTLALSLFLAVLPGRALAQSPATGMLRYPDVSDSSIVFLYANDLWVVSRDGGTASPLASPAGAELFPRFSPDGRTIAFVGNYGGGRDLYTVPVEGGVPERLTWHPASEVLCDWTPDNTLLFSSNGLAGLSRMPQLFTVSAEQPDMVALPIPYGTNGAISEDGRWLAYTPMSRDTRTWKRYRGGMASDIWLFNLKTKASKQITDFDGTDTLPMWHESVVYYLSDGGDEHRLNIWSYDTRSDERQQVTHFADYDNKWPSIGPGAAGDGEIVFQNGSHLYLLDLATHESRTVEVTIPGARPKLAPQTHDAAKNLNGGDISPKGVRVVVEARGDLWSLPVSHGTPQNLTRTDGTAERSPAWSPDGRWIAYFSDATGEYELYVTQSDGRGETRQLTHDGECWRYSPLWSPDSSRIVFTDKTGAVWLYTMATEELVHVTTDPWASRPTLTWSHDSRWLAFDRTLDTRAAKSAIFVYHVEDGKSTQLTSGFFNDSSPAFDRKGEFLYFASARNFTSPKYESQGTTFIYDDTDVLLALPLRGDVANPLLPEVDTVEFQDKATEDAEGDQDGGDDDENDSEDARSGDRRDRDQKDRDSDDDRRKKKKKRERRRRQAERADTQSKSDDSPTDADQKDDDEKPATLDIDVEGAERRAIALPVSPGAFRSLAVNDKNQLIYGRSGDRGSRSDSGIHLFDIHADEPEEKSVVSGTSGFGVSADGSKLLLSTRGNLYVIAAAAGQKLDEAVSTAAMHVTVDPRAEWQQIFTDAWRIERDFFYDPTMHGVDWEGVREHYAAMLDDCTSREDLAFVIGEMIAELNVGHAYYRGAGEEDQPSASTGLLGCDFQLADDGWVIGTLYEGADWDVDARNPLRAAGAQSGQILTAVNGVPVSTDRSVYAAFEGLAGQVVTLTVRDPDEDADEDAEPKDVVVELLRSDYELRFRHWIEQNRQRVDKASDGRIGYIYVTNTQVAGQNDLIRHLYGQLEKDALIIDERWNGGGQIPTRFIELLNRPATNLWARRDGRDWVWPPDAHQGPKCMLINGMSGSGGDMFPALFRQAELGPLIGRRTWGGLVGISGNPGMIDGSGVTAPTFAYYETDGTWGIEGHGVDPDIEVIDDPARMQNGRDPQLDRAIREMRKAIRSGGWQPPERPAYPDREGFGIAEEDK